MAVCSSTSTVTGVDNKGGGPGAAGGFMHAAAPPYRPSGSGWRQRPAGLRVEEGSSCHGRGRRGFWCGGGGCDGGLTLQGRLVASLRSRIALPQARHVAPQGPRCTGNIFLQPIPPSSPPPFFPHHDGAPRRSLCLATITIHWQVSLPVPSSFLVNPATSHDEFPLSAAVPCLLSLRCFLCIAICTICHSLLAPGLVLTEKLEYFLSPDTLCLSA